MKTSIKKIALVLLSVALLVSALVGISVSAAEEDGQVEILAQNIVYGDKVSIAYAVNATIEDAVSGKVKVAYYWETEGEPVIKAASLLDTTKSDSVYTVGDTSYPVFVTEGVAAKELTNVAYAVAFTGDTLPAEPDYLTYSAAQYLYARLYKDGFKAKTEADGKDYNRKLLYENLMAYSEQAQIVLDYKADKLISDYTIVCTSSELITIGEGKFAYGYGDVTVSGTVIGEGTIVGWTVTDLNTGAETTSNDVKITLNGAYSIDPIFGVHECVDVDPADHYCDSCGEIVSECYNNNATVDHKCDLCGKVIDACVDSNSNGRCDVCNIYTYEYDITTGASLYTFTSTGNANPANQTSITANSTSEGYYGVLASLAKDPANEVNQVLKLVINGGTNNSNTSGATKYPSNIDIYASEKVEGGKIHVLEYDMYVERLNKAAVRNFFELYAYDEAGHRSRLQNGGKDGSTNGHTKGILQVTGTEVVKNAFQVGVGSTQNENAEYANFDSHTWYRFRFVFDAANGTITAYVSFDNGSNWYLAAKEATTTSLTTENADFDATKIDRLAFGFTTYGHGDIFYIDNVRYVVTNTVPEAHTESGIDSVEATYR